MSFLPSDITNFNVVVLLRTNQNQWIDNWAVNLFGTSSMAFYLLRILKDA